MNLRLDSRLRGNDGVVVLDSAGVYPREGGDGNDGV
jgi:hypothetical protein